MSAATPSDEIPEADLDRYAHDRAALAAPMVVAAARGEPFRGRVHNLDSLLYVLLADARLAVRAEICAAIREGNPN